MKFFRIFGIGKNIEEAFQDALEREKENHEDLSLYLKENNYLVHKIENKKKSASELEYLILMHSLANKFKEIRDLTSSEKKYLDEFRELYSNYRHIDHVFINKKKYEHFKLRTNRCLGIKCNMIEKAKWKKNNLSKKGTLYRFIGHAEYKFLECDE